MSQVSQFLNAESLEEARSQIKKTNWASHNGTLYLTLPQHTQEDFDLQFDLISSAHLQDDDVFLCGFLRSGNHWVWEILHMILNQNTKFTDRIWSRHNIDIWGKDVQKKMDALEAPRVFGSHLLPQRLPKVISQKPIKIVYPIRNPKDVLTSWFKVSSKLIPGQNWPGDWDQFFDLQMTGEFLWGSWFDHVNGFDRFIRENPQVKVHVIQFEKLLENPVKEISELCRFLGESESLSLAADIAEATSFENMKRETQGKSEKENDYTTKRAGNVANVSGQANTWKSKFTVRQNEVFHAVFEQLMKGNKLADLVREYLK